MFLSLLLLAGGAGVFVLVSGKLYNQFDANLLSKADALQGLIGVGPQANVSIQNEQELVSLFSHKRGEEAYEVWVDGQVLSRSRWLKGDLEQPRDGTIQTFLFPNGHRARSARLDFTLPDPVGGRATGKQVHTVRIVVARKTEEIEESVGTVAAILAMVVAASVALAAAVIAWTIRFGLQPLRSLTDQVTQVNASSLNARISTDGASEELQPIVLRLNQLFERLEQAFQRERRFSANIAHELRTPLAELLTACEVALKWPGTREELIAALQEAHGSGIMMAGAIETLLSLSRCQSGRQSPQLEPVDVNGLCQQQWDANAADAQAKQLQVQLELRANHAMRSDYDMLRLVLANVISNAIAYTPPGGELQLRTTSNQQQCSITLSNKPHDLEETDLALLFEPFWRKGSARSEREHAGLGLALCRALCEVQGLECKASFAVDGALAIRIEGSAMPLEETARHNSEPAALL